MKDENLLNIIFGIASLEIVPKIPKNLTLSHNYSHMENSHHFPYS